ncbi:hypothetical protein Aduo_018157 [Ancylostoma duodenale]
MRSLILFSLIAFAWAQYGLPLPPAPVHSQPMYAAPALRPVFYPPRPMVVHYVGSNLTSMHKLSVFATKPSFSGLSIVTGGQANLMNIDPIGAAV